MAHAIEVEGAPLMLVAAGDKAQVAPGEGCKHSATCIKVERGLVHRRLARMIHEQRLVQEQRDRRGGVGGAQGAIEPSALRGLGGQTRRVEDLCVETQEQPAAHHEGPAILAEMLMPPRESHRIHALCHGAGDEVVADVVIAWQHAPGRGQTIKLRAGEAVVLLRIRVGQNKVAGDDDEVGWFSVKRLQHLFPIILVKRARGEEVWVGKLDDAKAHSISFNPSGRR